MNRQRVAAFVDVENMAVTLTPSDPARPQRLTRALEQEGDPVIRRAYADWSSASMAAHQRGLLLAGWEPVQVPCFGALSKNAVDVQLAVDAMAALTEAAQANTHVIVSGTAASPTAERQV